MLSHGEQSWVCFTCMGRVFYIILPNMWQAWISCIHIGRSPGRTPGYHIHTWVGFLDILFPYGAKYWISCTSLGKRRLCHVPTWKAVLNITHLHEKFSWISYTCISRSPRYYSPCMLCIVIGTSPECYVPAWEASLDVLYSHGM